MGPIGWPELIILLVVVLIVFGPGKLPDIGNAIGRGRARVPQGVERPRELDPRRAEQAGSAARAATPDDKPQA